MRTNTVSTETKWNVQFVGDYFVLTSTVTAEDEDEAIANATHLLLTHHGLDMDAISNEINIC